MRDEFELETHLDVLSRSALHLAFEAWAEDAWERHFPDVGEYDFERILTATRELLPADAAAEEFGEAYAFFEARAEEVV